MHLQDANPLLFDLAREVIGIFAHDGSARVLNPHCPPLGTTRHIHDLVDAGHHPQLEQCLREAANSDRAGMVAPFRGGSISLEWRFRTIDRDSMYIGFSPVEPGASLAHAAVAHTHSGIALSDVEGRIRYANDALLAMYGYTREDMLGRLFTDFLPPENRAAAMERHLAHINQFVNPGRRETVIVRASGEHRFIDLQTGRVELPEGIFRLSTVLDITEERRQRTLADTRTDILEQIARGNDLADVRQVIINGIETYHPGLTVAICGLRDGLLTIDAGPALSNPCFEAINGRPPSELGGVFTSVLNTTNADIAHEVVRDDIADRRLRHTLGECRAAGMAALPVRNHAREILGLIIIICRHETDLTDDVRTVLHEFTQLASLAFERQRMTDELLHQAQYDALTGLPNRALLEDRLNHLLLDAERYDYAVAVLMIDLDEFKQINDSLGHNVGDMLLQQVAGIIKACLRRGDTVARFGGDEFVVVAPISETVRASDIAERILADLQSTIAVDGFDLSARPSIGISLAPRDANTSVGLIQAADMAMYQAKNTGKNRYRFFSEEMNQEISTYLRVEGELRNALADGELSLYCQPVVRCADGVTTEVETVLRWHHPDRGLLLPDDFLPIAEQSNLIGEIDRFAISAAVDQLARWQKDRTLRPRVDTLVIHVPVHGLALEVLAREMARILSTATISPACIRIGLTEDALARDFERRVGQLRDLRERVPGIGLAIDDFSMEGLSFEQLRELPVDVWKMTPQFISAINTPEGGKRSAAIVRTIVNLAHDLELLVIAAGVELEQQAEFLQSVGCDRAQGRMFSPPMACTDFEQELRKR